MAEAYSLSYVVTTRNKLPWLREVMTRLLRHRQSDEEIVVVDGASTDGTAAYLRELHAAGSVQQWESAPDHGEAHGYNKALLRAQGTLIKFITDDDAFHWGAIQTGKQFMLAHPKVDVLGANGGATDWSLAEPFVPLEYDAEFKAYCAQRRPFPCCGLGLMLRRSSLALTGLLHTGFVRVDCEFSLRVTASRARLAWFTGAAFVRIFNPQSNTITREGEVVADTARLAALYAAPGADSPGRLARMAVRAWLRPLRRKLNPGLPAAPAAQAQAAWRPREGWPAVFSQCDAWLERRHREQPGQFLAP